MMQSSRMKSRQTGPPDGGYGWVVVVSAFLVMGLTAAVFKNIGLFFLEIQSHFGVLTSTTSWITSATIATFHLGGSMAGALSMRFSHRVVIMVGGLLSASGMVLASLNLSLPWMYLSMGVLHGLGMSFSWTPSTSMISQYFLRWRPIAYAISSSGECVFAMMFSPLFQWLIEAYTWQGALLVIGGLQLNLCACGAVMRPLEQTPNSQFPAPTNNKDDQDSTAVNVTSPKKLSFQWTLLRKPELILYNLFGVFSAAGFFVSMLFLVPFANGLGMEQYWAASILSVMAFADLGGRLACGWLANMRLMRNMQLLTVVMTVLGVVLLLLPPFGQNYSTLLVFCSLYGFLYGCVVTIHVTTIIDIVGLAGFDSGLGLFMFFRGIGGFIGPPAAGWLVDWTGDFGVGFYLSGVCFLASGIFLALVDRLMVRSKTASSDSPEHVRDPELSA